MSTRRIMCVFVSLIVITATAGENRPKSPRTIGGDKLAQRPPSRPQKQPQDTQKQVSPERTKIEQFYADRLAEVEERYRKEMVKLEEDKEEYLKLNDHNMGSLVITLRGEKVPENAEVPPELDRIRAATREAKEVYERDKRYFEKKKAFDLAELEKSEQQKRDKQIKGDSSVAMNTVKSPRTIGSNKLAQRLPRVLQKQPQDTQKQVSPERTKIEQFYADRLAEVELRYSIEMAKLEEDELDYVKLHYLNMREKGIPVLVWKRWGEIVQVYVPENAEVPPDLDRIRAAKREAKEDYERDKSYFEKKKAYDLAELEKSEQQKRDKQIKGNSPVARNTVKSRQKMEPRGLITGIVLGDKPFVIINGEIMQPGQTIDGFKILNISGDSGVEFEKEGKRWTQRVGDKPNALWDNNLQVKPVAKIVPTPTRVPQRGLITGIFYSEEKILATIGTQIVSEGDSIGSVKIIKIHKDKVEFEKNGKRWTQRVGDKPNTSWENIP